MPHIVVKMLKGRTEEQKAQLSQALQKALMQELSTSKAHVSVSVEDYTPQQWQAIFKEEITDKPETLKISPEYDPKSLL